MLWWRRLDSNQRTQCGQIYSLLPLTTRPPLLRQARNYSTACDGCNSLFALQPLKRPAAVTTPAHRAAQLDCRDARPHQNQTTSDAPSRGHLATRGFVSKLQQLDGAKAIPIRCQMSAPKTLPQRRNALADAHSHRAPRENHLSSTGSKVASSLDTLASHWLCRARTEDHRNRTQGGMQPVGRASPPRLHRPSRGT